MRRIMTFCVAASLAVFGASACNNFLSSDNVKADPNNPIAATADQLFVGVQAGQVAQQEGIIALIGCMWIQQCTGTSNFLSTLEKYNIASEDTPSAAFSAIYEGGGLVDIKKIEAIETAAGNQQFLAPYLLGARQVADAMGALKAETKGTATGPQLTGLADSIAAWQTWAEVQRAEIAAAGPKVDVVASAQGKVLFDEFRSKSAGIQSTSQKQVTAADARVRDQSIALVFTKNGLSSKPN